jgi:hypothetical protein
MGIICFYETEHTRALWAQNEYFLFKNGDRSGGILPKGNSFLECNIVMTFNCLTKLVLEWDLKVSMKYSITEHYEAKWMFLQLKNDKIESNPMKCRLHSLSGTWCQTFYLLTQLVLEWGSHVSMKYSKIEHYELKWIFLQIENSDRWRMIPCNADSTSREGYCEGNPTFFFFLSYFFIIYSHV